jgi:hypothetical protein
MPFISNAQNFTLGDGVYNNIQGDVVNNIFLGRKRHRGEIDGNTACSSEVGKDITLSILWIDALSPLALTFHTPKRQRMENPQPSDGLKVSRVSLASAEAAKSLPGHSKPLFETHP